MINATLRLCWFLVSAFILIAAFPLSVAALYCLVSAFPQIIHLVWGQVSLRSFQTICQEA